MEEKNRYEKTSMKIANAEKLLENAKKGVEVMKKMPHFVRIFR